MQWRWGAIGCPLLGSAASMPPGSKNENQIALQLVVLFLSRNGGVSSVFSPRKPKALHIYKENSISDEITLEVKSKFKKIRYLVTQLL